MIVLVLVDRHASRFVGRNRSRSAAGLSRLGTAPVRHERVALVTHVRVILDQQFGLSLAGGGEQNVFFLAHGVSRWN